MKIGILTSGGDCPGLNAVIRGAVLKGIAVHGHEFVGFLDGWPGVVEADVIGLARRPPPPPEPHHRPPPPPHNPTTAPRTRHPTTRQRPKQCLLSKSVASL